MKHDITTLEQLDTLAATVAANLRGGEVLALSGTLGAGKTTFVQHLAKHLGVAERITSPTFTLMHVHATRHSSITHLVHVDAYRLSGPAEFAAIGIGDYLGAPGVVTVVEWAEKVTDIFPKQVTWLLFSLKGKKRSVEIKNRQLMNEATV